MIKNLLPLIPKHKIYVEPFCGGASLFFAKPEVKVTNQNGYREVLNDTSKDLIHLYYIAQAYPEKFLAYLDRFPYSEYWYSYFKKNKNCKHPIRRAVGVYFRIMNSFANKMDDSFSFGKRGANRPIQQVTHRKRLPEIVQRLQGVQLFCRDALSVIERFDHEHSFFYCDPPYPNTSQGSYKGYTQQHFEKLLAVLSNCKGSFMLSCYENEAVPKDWERFEFDAVCSASSSSNSQKRKEIVWRKLNKTQPIQLPLFQPSVVQKYEDVA